MNAPKMPTTRSRVTNGTDMLPGVDRRSSQARRYRDLCAEFARHIAGSEKLSPVEDALVRQAAALTVQSEAMQAAIVNGEAVEHDEVVRVSNAAMRILSRLEKRRKAIKPPSVADWIKGAKTTEAAL